MSGESIITIWTCISTVLFFALSLLGGALLVTLAVWKMKELWPALRAATQR